MTTILWPLAPKRLFNIALAALFMLATAAAEGAELVVRITDEKDGATSDAVVTFTPEGGAAAPSPRAEEVVQMSQEFSPSVTVVPVGSRVRFPNRDKVAHHVYSFSPAKTFDIPLYTGDSPATVVFGQPGVVTLGCNIHDWMVAHIYVTATPHYAVSDAQGVATLKGLPTKPGTLEIWHPRLKGEPLRIELAAGAQPEPVKLRLRPDFKRRKAPAAGEGAGGYR